MARKFQGFLMQSNLWILQTQPLAFCSQQDETTYEAMRSNIYRQTMDYFTEKFEKSLPMLIEDEMQKRSQQNGRGMETNFADYSPIGRGESGNRNGYGFRQNQMSKYDRGQEMNQGPNQVGKESQDYTADRSEIQIPEDGSENQGEEGGSDAGIPNEPQEPQALQGNPSEDNFEYSEEQGNSGGDAEKVSNDYDVNGNDDQSFQVDKILEPEPENPKSSAVILGYNFYFSLLPSAFTVILSKLTQNA